MARQSVASTRDPRSIALGRPVIHEHASAALETLNYAWAKRPQTHLSMTTGPTSWASNAVATLSLNFRTGTSSSYEVLRFYVRIRADAQTLEVGARCYFDTATYAGSVIVTIGAWTETITCSDSDNGTEKTATVQVEDCGTGWQLVTVALKRTVGMGTADYLRNLRIEELDVADADLPGPYLGHQLHLVPHTQSVTGTTETLVGAAYLPAGVSTIHTLLGCASSTDAATLTVRRLDTGASAGTVGGSDGLVSAQDKQVTLPVAGWYTFALNADAAAGVALIEGLTLDWYDETIGTHISIIPSSSEVTGTTETLVGALYLAGTATTIRALLASSPTTDTANIRIRDTSGTLMATVSRTGALADATTTNITFTAGWYLVYLYGSAAATVASCHGIRLEMTMLDSVNLIPVPNRVTGTTEQLLGSFYLRAGRARNIKAFMGCDVDTDTATVTLRLRSTGGSLGTITRTDYLGGATRSDTTIGTEGWHIATGKASSATAVGNFIGVRMIER